MKRQKIINDRSHGDLVVLTVMILYSYVLLGAFRFARLALQCDVIYEGCMKVVG